MQSAESSRALDWAQRHIEDKSDVHVQVKLYSRFREHLPPEAKGQATIDLPDGATVGHLLDHLGIVRRVQLLTVNDEPDTNWERPLDEGDSVRVFPFVVGG